jgi:hypothetical protein
MNRILLGILGTSVFLGRAVADDGGANQAAEADRANLVSSGAAAPSPGGDIRGEPNLFDLEFLTARLTIRSPDKTLTTVTIAPFLGSPYQPLLSEARIGIFAESSGAFGLGAAWGYNQARARLARSSLPRGHVDDDKMEKLRGPLASAVQVACSVAANQGCKTGDASALCRMVENMNGFCRQEGKSLSSVADQLLQAISVGEVARAPQQYAAAAALPAWAVEFAQAHMQLQAARDAYDKASDEAAKKADDRSIKSSRVARLEEKYRRSVGVNVLGALGWFPLINAPPIAPKMDASAADAYAEHFRNADLGAAVRYYFIRTVLIQGRGGYRWDRASAIKGTEITGQYYVGFDFAAMKPFGKEPDDSGFQPGIGGGLSVLEYRCTATAGCSTELELGDPYPKTGALDHRTQLTGFIEWRVRKEFQARLSIDVFVDKVKGRIPGTNPTDGSPRLFHTTPSLSVGSSFWGL